MSRPRLAIVFDLDDTLYAEQSYTFSGYQAVAEAFAPRLAAEFDLSARMRSLFDSPDRARVFNVIVEELGAPQPDALIADMVETFRAHRPTIQLFPDAAAALERLAGGGPLGLISDGHLVTQQAKVEALKLRERIDEIILTGEWGQDFWKPHPRAFEEMTQRLDVPHSACVYVADNRKKDFIAPNALGWRTVFVDRPRAVYADNAAPPGGAPQLTIPTLDTLEEALRG
jgi:putative hydrolase of the HAD superfamily